MKEPIKITRLEANKILIDQKSKPMKKCTIAWKGQWYDVRELTEGEINAFIIKLTGIKPTPENTLNIDL